MFRNFLDLMVLRLVQQEPLWGYKIIKYAMEKHGISIRHGALYPLLNNLEREGYLKSRKEAMNGRVRKIYEITSKGMKIVNTYNDYLKEQIEEAGIKT